MQKNILLLLSLFMTGALFSQQHEISYIKKLCFDMKALRKAIANKKIKSGDTTTYRYEQPLSSVFAKINPDVLPILHEAGWHFQVRESDGYTILHALCRGLNNQNKHALQILLSLKCCDVNALNNDNESPLHIASQFAEESDYVLQLLQAGADPKLIDKYDNTVFDLLVRCGDPSKSIRYLAIYGIDLNDEKKKLSIDDLRRREWSHSAACQQAGIGRLEGWKARSDAVVEEIKSDIWIGEPRDALPTMMKYSPLVYIKKPHEAENFVSQDYVKYLFGIGYKLDTEILNRAIKDKRITPYSIVNACQTDPLSLDLEPIIHYAAFQTPRYKKVINILQKSGFGINQRDKDGKTVLHQCISTNNQRALGFFIKNNAYIHAKDHDGHEPIHDSVQRNPDNMETLLKNGADANSLDYKGESAFHAALRLSEPNILYTLKKYGTDMHQPFHGKSPLDWCDTLKEISDEKNQERAGGVLPAPLRYDGNIDERIQVLKAIYNQEEH